MLGRVWIEESPPTLCWECKLVLPLRKTVWRWLEKLKIEDLIIPFLSIYPDKIITQKDTHTQCSQQLYLQYPRHGDNLNISWQTMQRCVCVCVCVLFSSVQLISRVWLFVIPWTAACQASLYITNSQSLLKLISIESVMPSNHLILCCPLLLLPSIFPSIRVFSNESVLCIRWPKYWHFSFTISSSNEHPGLISLRMDWFDLLAVQGTLKSLLQHHSSKSSILWCSAFFIVQLSPPYMTSGKTIALTRWTFVSKVMSLFFNILSRLVITLLPRSKHLLISWLQSPSAGILEPPKLKSLTVSFVSPSICHEVMGPDAMILVFWMLSQNLKKF